MMVKILTTLPTLCQLVLLLFLKSIIKNIRKKRLNSQLQQNLWYAPTLFFIIMNLKNNFFNPHLRAVFHCLVERRRARRGEREKYRCKTGSSFGCLPDTPALGIAHALGPAT